ncbi:DoxX family protein [Labrys okinawensis]|uniref:DoxX family protein n=1 Tax=Labrys okinawensis TaxID=346911 RepID=UPI0039BD19A9
MNLLSPETNALVLTAGRILLGGLFVFGGLRHLALFHPVSEAMRARRVPFAPLVLLGGTIFQILAGLLLMAGWLVALSGLGLALFTLLASLMMHNFWSLEGDARTAAFNGWQSNLAIIGGLLIAAAQAG